MMGFIHRDICVFCILVFTGLGIVCSEGRNDGNNDTCKEELSVLKGRLEQLEDKFSKLPQTKTDPLQHGDITRRLLDGDLVSKKYAFYARVSSRLGTVTHNQVIVFGYADTNIGQAYNTNSGVFRCQQAGVYLFSVTILAFSNKGAEFTLVKNGAEVGYIYARSDSSGRDDSGSNTFILDLNVSDDVWVKIHEGFHDDGDIIDPNFSTFSGVFLY